MTIARLPDNEKARLSALQMSGLLDSEPEERFDRITRLAALVFDVPIALVSLVDEHRQWFKSRHGTDLCQTDRSSSFCAHAILQAELFEIPDASIDARFQDNPLVVDGPGIRFYAGVPISDGSGHVLGTLCLIDRQPRQLSATERHCLLLLGQLVNDEISSLSRHILASVAEQTSNAVIITDPQGITTWVNPGFSRMTGYSAAEMIGHRPGELLQGPKTSLNTIAEMHRSLASGNGFEVEILNYDKAGRPFWVHIQCNPLRQPDGRVHGYIAIQSDIGKLKQSEQLKRELTMTISHELRTPLTSLAGALDLLGEGASGELPAASQRLVAIARSNSQRMKRLIDDLLDLEKLRVGDMEFNCRPHALKPLLDQAAANHRTFAGNKTVDLIVTDSDQAGLILTDACRFQQIMSNLISNAVKFSPDQAQVVITVGHQAGQARIEVHDQGPGISREDQARLFQPFRQLNSGDEPPHGGSGLGLAISKALVEGMGGQIGIDSDTNQGCCVWFTQPLAEHEDQEKDPAPP
ncbi:MAG: ATP-binding protein [Wenzhouxiangella sp.]